MAIKNLSVFFKRLCLLTACVALTGLMFNGRAVAYNFFYWDHGATGLESALYGAELAERPLILYFHVQECAWCEKMDNTYLATESVENFLMEMYKVEFEIGYKLIC